ncbi:MAG: MATE family efflux transporter [Spirochaetaceae bacterium]|jgi:putative MATE family efflux protein|nr:MATE family efflux transporter [Spirochaetaceae bacterium]
MEHWNNQKIRRLLWPLIVEQLLAVTIGIADTAMVTSTGETAISGVSLVDQINQLLIILMSALAMGGSVVVSQYIGREDSRSAASASKQLLLFNLIFSIGVMTLTLVFHQLILSLVYGNLDADVMSNAVRYFRLYALSLPFFAVYTAAGSLFRAAGNSRLPMFAAVLMNVVNISANAIFIFGFKMGVAGAALGTVLCRVVGGIFLLFLLLKSKNPNINPHCAPKTTLTLEPVMIKRILKIGIPGAIENSLFQFGKIFLARVVSSFGTASIAANAISGAVASFIYMPGTGFCMAILTVAGQCIGAKDYEGAKFWTYKLMKTTYIALISLNIMIFFCMDLWLGVFDLSPETIVLTKQFLTLHCISSSIGWPLSFALPNALRAAGDAKFVMITAVCTMWLVRISSSYIFAYVLDFKALSVWMGMALDFFLRGAIFTVRWRGGKWQTKHVI